jgi:uncharacterized membrane protein (DUF485 family)
MIRRLTTQLPDWARPDHPVIRYVLGTQMSISWRGWLTQLFAAALALAGAYIFARFTPEGLGEGASLSEQFMTAIYWPTVLLQVALSVSALVYTTSAISGERRRQNWDNLRATHSGAGLTLRAQWSAAVFYRLSGLLTAIYLVRLAAVALLVYDLTAFRGEYLNYLIGAVTPDVPIGVGIILLALLMTASFILPLTGLGLDAAVGLLISTFVNGRVFVAMAQILFGLARFALAAGLIGLMVWTGDPFNGASALGRGAAALGMGSFGDWGLRYLHLGYSGEIWAAVPYSLLLGAALLVISFVQAALTDLLLAWAVRRAERRE